jgi:hypothetical protein
VLAVPVVRGFMTSGQVDAKGGSITSITPANGATNVALNSVVMIQFNENVDPVSVSASSISIYNQTEGRYVEGTLSMGKARNEVIYTPPGGLFTRGHRYNLYISNGSSLLDLSGNSFGYSNTSFTVQN